jgi:quercetin dioxygenase-like cupin family protein
MYIKNVRDIEAEVPDGTRGVRMRVAIGRAEGAPRFVLRHFEVEPGGSTPSHSHWWEHEIYVIDGRGEAVTEEGVRLIESGDTVLVPPDEDHQFRNTGDTPLKFICIIPHIDE